MAMISFDENGDLVLLVRDRNDADEADVSETRFLVSSKVMSLMSPVWKAMLSGRFQEATATNEIPLPDDDSRALEYLLCLAHLKFNMLWEPTVTEIRQIAILCDKYDMASLCRFRIHGWWDETMEDERRSRTPSAIFFAWTFGYADWLAAELVACIREWPIAELRAYKEDTVAPPRIAGILLYSLNVLLALIGCRAHVQCRHNRTRRDPSRDFRDLREPNHERYSHMSPPSVPLRDKCHRIFRSPFGRLWDSSRKSYRSSYHSRRS